MPQPQPDSDELARFRAEWRDEVERRKTSTSTTATVTDEPPRKFEIPLPTPAAASKATIVSDFPNAPHSASQSSALAVYRSAVENEERGDTDEALRLYRIAFRKDPNVERLFYREEIISSAAAFKRHTDRAPVKEKHTSVVATKTLAKVIAGFPEHLAFDPEVEEESVPLNGLPDEILVRILLGLDPTSLERFAVVSRKARVFTLDSAIWRCVLHCNASAKLIETTESLFMLRTSHHNWRIRQSWIPPSHAVCTTFDVYTSSNHEFGWTVCIYRYAATCKIFHPVWFHAWCSFPR